MPRIICVVTILLAFRLGAQQAYLFGQEDGKARTDTINKYIGAFLVEFSDGPETLTYDTNQFHITVPVTISGQPSARLIFDTGALTLLTHDAFTALNGQILDTSSATDASGNESQFVIGILDSLQVGPLLYRKVIVGILQEVPPTLACYNFAGLFGWNALMANHWVVDPQIGQLTAIPKNQSVALKGKHYKLRMAGLSQIIKLKNGLFRKALKPNFDTGDPDEASLALTDVDTSRAARRAYGLGSALFDSSANQTYAGFGSQFATPKPYRKLNWVTSTPATDSRIGLGWLQHAPWAIDAASWRLIRSEEPTVQLQRCLYPFRAYQAASGQAIVSSLTDAFARESTIRPGDTISSAKRTSGQPFTPCELYFGSANRSATPNTLPPIQLEIRRGDVMIHETVQPVCYIRPTD